MLDDRRTRHTVEVPISDDGDFLDEVNCCLCKSDSFLRRFESVLRDEDFDKTGRGRRVNAAIIARVALAHFRQYGTPVGRLLKAQIREYASKHGFEAERRDQLLKTVTRIRQRRPDTNAVGELLIGIIRHSRQHAALDKLISAIDKGPVSDEEWLRITEGATVPECGSTPPTNAATLYATEMVSAKHLVRGILQRGRLTMLAGKPKSHKTWLAFQLGLATALGGNFLGREVRQPGRVLFFEFDDEPSQLQERLLLLHPTATSAEREGFAKLDLRYRLRRLQRGGLRELGAILKSARDQNEAYRLVVIDPYLAVRSPREKNADLVRDDYGEIADLRRICSENDCTVLLVHHLRKAAGTDGSDLISGTSGLAAAVDAWWIVTTDPADNRFKRMEIKGRSIRDRHLKIGFRVRGANPGVFVAGEGPEVVAGPEEKKILDLLRSRGPLRPRRIAAILGKAGNSIYQILHRMRRRDMLLKQDGCYRLPGRRESGEASKGSKNVRK